MPRRNGSNQIGYAIVGIGHIVQSQALPGFANVRNARPVALVSGDRRKLRRVGKQYDIPDLYSYDDFEECLASDDVDAVYIALPNDMHEEYVIRAARAGVHVLCEKPMALDARSCKRMIDACEKAGVKLMIAYRLHFEPANLRAVELVKRGRIGKPRYFNSSFSFQVQPDNIRVDSERGGGPVWDIGIYCLNAARYLFEAEPTEVFAMGTRRDDPRFSEVDETVSVVMRFPDERTASFTCSFGSAPASTFRVSGTKGEIVLENAYEYVGERKLYLTTRGKTKEENFAEVDQFGPEFIYFAECIRRNVEPEPNGWEGLADVRVINAIHRSIRTGRPVKLPLMEQLEQRHGPTQGQKFKLPSVSEKKLVNVQEPTQ